MPEDRSEVPRGYATVKINHALGVIPVAPLAQIKLSWLLLANLRVGIILANGCVRECLELAATRE